LRGPRGCLPRWSAQAGLPSDRLRSDPPEANIDVIVSACTRGRCSFEFMCYYMVMTGRRGGRRGPRPARKPSYLRDSLLGLGLGFLAAAALITWHHQRRAGLIAAVGLTLLLLWLLAVRRSRRRAPSASPRPVPTRGNPPGSWPEQPTADFDHWQPADRQGVIDSLDAGQLAEVLDYMASLDPELFGQAVRSLDEEA
jgi:hypothetical protein